MQATPENIDYLKSEVNSLTASGATDMYRAFDLAFDVLAKTDPERSAQCETGILFLTDGQPSNVEDHIELIRNRNQGVNAHIFTYALGSGAIVQDDIGNWMFEFVLVHISNKNSHKIKQNKIQTKQNKTKQNQTKQNQTKSNKIKQNKTKQNNQN